MSLEVKRGEILGLAGLVGSGRTELARAIFGIDAPLGGTIRLNGESIVVALAARRNRPWHLSCSGGPQAHRSSARRLGRREHICCPISVHTPTSWIVLREPETRERRTAKATPQYRRAPNVVDARRLIVGGNQQKVVLARWLSMRPLSSSSMSRRVASTWAPKTEIYELMRQLADSGVGILMISSDMEEVIGVSDRIAVMHEGEISGFLRATGSVRPTCCSSPWAHTLGRTEMFKKDLGLLVLIWSSARWSRSSIRDFSRRSISSNTGNLIGLFGLFSIAEAFVIITGGIELSVGSVDCAAGRGLRRILSEDWAFPGAVALLIVIGLGVVMGLCMACSSPGCGCSRSWSHSADCSSIAALPASTPRTPPQGSASVERFPDPRMADGGPDSAEYPHSLIAFAVVAVVMAVVLHKTVLGRYLFRGRKERGGGALFGHSNSTG